MERFFDTVNDPVVDDVVLTPAAFANRLNKASIAIRVGLRTPDILGVQEMDNINALTALGVMQKLSMAPGPIRRIHVSRAGDFGRVQLDAADYDRPWFGQVVVARDFGQALESRLQELSRLRRYRPMRFLGLGDVIDGYRQVRVADDSGERVLLARLVVGADGTSSGVR